jgi:hypothetical protein
VLHLISLRRNTVSIKVPKLLHGIRVRHLVDGSFLLARHNTKAEKWLDEHCIRMRNQLRWLPKLSDEISVETLRGMYKNIPCYIVGKGPSLDSLEASYFVEEDAPILAINEAIHVVNGLQLPNPIFLVQTDTGLKIDPGDATLLLAHTIKYLYPDKLERYLWRAEMFGYGTTGRLTAEIAIKIAGLFGCSYAEMLAFDACTIGDTRYADSIGHQPESKDGDTGGRFLTHRDKLDKAAFGVIDLEWIKPEDLSGADGDSTPL